jgi:hypothetical protein
MAGRPVRVVMVSSSASGARRALCQSDKCVLQIDLREVVADREMHGAWRQ